jgi:hypothetical protein
MLSDKILAVIAADDVDLTDDADVEGAVTGVEVDAEVTGGARGFTVILIDFREKDDECSVCDEINFSLSISSGL